MSSQRRSKSLPLPPPRPRPVFDGESSRDKLRRMVKRHENREGFDPEAPVARAMPHHFAINTRKIRRLEHVNRSEHDDERSEIGQLMMNWHGGQWDPIYMVASYFVSGEKYPDPQVVSSAQGYIEQNRRKTKKRADKQELAKISQYLEDDLLLENYQARLDAGEFDEPEDMTRNGAVTRNEVTRLYANPYNTQVNGFYFESIPEFQAGMRKLKRQGAEEVEIDFIDGSPEDTDLFPALHINQGNLEVWFEQIEPLTTLEKAGLYALASNGETDLEEMIGKVQEDNPIVFEGTVKDYAEDYVGDVGIENITNPEFYFDFDGFGRDLQLNGDIDPDDYEGMSDEEIGEQVVDEFGGFKEISKANREMYFDYDKFANDLEQGGDVTEVNFAGTTYVMDNNR